MVDISFGWQKRLFIKYSNLNQRIKNLVEKSENDMLGRAIAMLSENFKPIAFVE